VRHSKHTSTIIVGQHTLLREGLVALLQQSPYKVIASAGRASDLKDARTTSDRQPLVIVATDDTVGSSVEAADDIRILRTRFDRPTIVVIAETRNPVNFQQITALDPNGYIVNLTSRDLLLKVLDLSAPAQLVLVLSSVATMASASERLALPERAEALLGNGQNRNNNIDHHGAGPLFSDREQQILRQLACGSANKEIARVFSITESTVKVHLKALLRKIGARNRTQAAIWAVGKGYSTTTHHSLTALQADPAPLLSVQKHVPVPA
jgi:two-component system, NarL family, nitrate/nitrite response regulator NarL